MSDVEARATAARLQVERALGRLERTDPATSGRARLRVLALGRERRAGRLTPQEYAEQLERLTRDLIRSAEPALI